jgi:hypothetical protein
MPVRYFAIRDQRDQELARNLLIMDDVAEARADLLTWSDSDKRWVEDPGLITYIFGDDEGDRLEVTRTGAQELATLMGIPLPDEEGVRAILEAQRRDAAAGPTESPTAPILNKNAPPPDSRTRFCPACGSDWSNPGQLLHRATHQARLYHLAELGDERDIGVECPDCATRWYTPVDYGDAPFENQ